MSLLLEKHESPKVGHGPCEMVHMCPLPWGFLLRLRLKYGAPVLGEDATWFHLFLNTQDKLRIVPGHLVCVLWAIFGCEKASLLDWNLCRSLEIFLKGRSKFRAGICLIPVDKRQYSQRRPYTQLDARGCACGVGGRVNVFVDLLDASSRTTRANSGPRRSGWAPWGG
jgi:hypothetical protein